MESQKNTLKQKNNDENEIIYPDELDEVKIEETG